jgi:hypothetical protein
LGISLRWPHISFRPQALKGVRTALTICAPDLDDKEADNVAFLVLNNMKTMVGMAMKDAPTSPGAPNELRLMNRLYLAAKLRTGVRRATKQSDNSISPVFGLGQARRFDG